MTLADPVMAISTGQMMVANQVMEIFTILVLTQEEIVVIPEMVVNGDGFD
ncbi:MAG: hypothetical protein WAW52_10415 [Methanothrix sp.]